MQNSRYAVLGFGAVIIAGGLAAYYGMAPQQGAQSEPPAAIGAQQPQPSAAVSGTANNAAEPANNAAARMAPQTDADKPALTAELPLVTVPVFDVLRLEGDGSLVIAGKAAPNAIVDVISKTRVLGSAKAGANGDFAIILDEALKAGDYQLVLRATAEDKSVATSQQTAILSVPQTPQGQVLALVEEPGKASRMITKPHLLQLNSQDTAAETGTAAALLQPAPDTATAPSATDANQPAVTAEQSATAPNNIEANTQANTSEVATDQTAIQQAIGVEAVEIDGTAIFIAGYAKGGNSVNVSANEIVLGSAVISPEGRYLLQSQQALAVGDYIIRADLLDKAGAVIASARVPFRREAGEAIAAIAPKTAKTAPLPASDDRAQPAEKTGAASTDHSNAEPLEKTQGSVIIRKGDNLWTISKRTYGSGMRYTTIYLANTDQIKNPDLIWPGQVFVMPDTPADNANNQ